MHDRINPATLFEEQKGLRLGIAENTSQPWCTWLPLSSKSLTRDSRDTEIFQVMNDVEMQIVSRSRIK